MSAKNHPAAPTARMMGQLLDWSSHMAFENFRNTVDTAHLAANSSFYLLEGGVFPALEQWARINQELTRQLTDTLKGKTNWTQTFRDTSAHVRAASKYARLVNTLGKDLFGTATFPGEKIIAENKWFRLVHIPPADGVKKQPVSVFHAGGLIPYGDRVFRLMPEVNFYDRFRERGLPVYAMELNGDQSQVDYGDITLDVIIETLQQFSDHAFAHNKKRKMVLEGYCGHATQAYAYVAAMPEDAERKFSVMTTFVGPVDGSKCTGLARAVKLTPERMMDANLTIWGMFGGQVPGQSTRMGLDLPLKSVFYKTPLGYFTLGWNRTDLLNIKSLDELTQSQRRDLAGTYWVSPDSANRFPVSVGVSRFTTSLFRQGLGKKGEIPWSYEGKPLSLQTILEETNLKLVGFYGGRDEVVPDRTAHQLINIFGDRYHHVVHPHAGHISYVLSPRLWQPTDRKPFRPNPIDLMLEYANNQ